MAGPDLSTLAGLLAVAQDPQAAQQAREFLLNQKLQAEEAAARANLAEAAARHEAKLQEAQLTQRRAEQAQQGKQFEAEQGRLTRESRLGREMDLLQLGEQKRQFNVSQAQSAQQHQDEMAIQEAKLIQDAVDRGLQTYAAMAKNRAAAGEGGFSAKDFFAAMPGGVASLLPETKENAPYEQRVAAARQAYLSAVAVTQPGITPEVATKQFDDMERVMRVSLVGVPEAARERALTDLQTALSSTEVALDNGIPLTPQQETEFIGQAGSRIATAALEGTGLSPIEQMRFAAYWNQQYPGSDETKAQILDKTLDYAVASIKLQRQWTDDQALEFRGALQAAIASAVDNGSEAVLKDILRPEAPPAGRTVPEIVKKGLRRVGQAAEKYTAPGATIKALRQAGGTAKTQLQGRKKEAK